MKLFLAHKIDLYGKLDSWYIGVFENGDVRKFEIEEILNYQYEIITYELTSLLHKLRIIYKGYLPYLTDIGQIIKINSGRSKKSYPKNHYPWFFWNRINRDCREEEAKRLFTIIRCSTDLIEISKTLTILAQKVKLYYINSISRIRKQNQYSRFYKVENEIQQFLNSRQIEGITIDILAYNNVVKELESRKDVLINNLRYKYKITNINYKSLMLCLAKQGFKINEKHYDYFDLLSFLKVMRISSELCNDIYTTLRLKADYDNLLQYIPEDGDLIYPEFDCIGTVTSRILIRYPHIQQLKRENRKIFTSKEGFTFLYCDYNQFEPGILASLSKDEVMIDLYNSEDIYVNFSNYLFGTKTLREEAKILFLSYLYGMSNKRILSSIENIIKSKGLTKNTSASDFFSKFKKLENFKNKEVNKARENGFIQSKTALRRNIKKTKQGKGKKSETRFVLSQLIQGSASYILKKSILDTMKDNEIEFLIPMHDAVLYQVPSSKIKEKKNLIEKCFIDNFKDVCPEINASVDFKPFHE
jgi:DNA polymerase I-like protein with 3'-5' exonuclease and polymerase domains